MAFLTSFLLLASMGFGWGDFVSCDRSYKKIGCYHEAYSGVSMSKIVLNDRNIINWDRYPETLHSLVCRCAKKARQMQMRTISVRFYGECWASNEVPSFLTDSNAFASTCISNSYGKCDQESEQECAGEEHTDYIYRLVALNVNGGYTEWSAWSNCSAFCGSGKKSRGRTCSNPAPTGQGKDCSGLGPEMENVNCQVKECPVHGGFTEWKPAFKCTKSCDSGTMLMTRTCTSPKPQNGGKNCQGPTKMETICNTKPCPVDGGYSKWIPASKCSRSCNAGVMKMRRTCTSPKPAHGGRECSGPSRKAMRCNMGRCPGKSNRVVICENTERNISCPDGKTIFVKKAYYGRRTSQYCHYRKHFNLRCQSKSSPALIRQRCHGHRSCHLIASNEVYGDPCRGTVKYLDIRYTCTVPQIRTAYTCDNAPPKTITCPTGYIIKVMFANYGRHSSKLCPGQNQQNIRCASRKSFFKVKASCDHKRRCKIYASKQVFGDPCPGTRKYLYLKYRCFGRRRPRFKGFWRKQGKGS